MKNIILLFAFLLTTTVSAQSKLGIMGSFLYNVPDTDLEGNDTVDEESKAGFGVGMRALIPLANGVSFRTGAGFVQKNFAYEVTQGTNKGKADFTFLYLNVPATLYIHGNDKLGVFLGTAINARLEDDCDFSGVVRACNATGKKSLVLPVVLGFDVAFTEVLSMELSYEYGIMEAIKDVKVSSAVLSLIYNF